jgi:hypothetical protein
VVEPSKEGKNKVMFKEKDRKKKSRNQRSELSKPAIFTYSPSESTPNGLPTMCGGEIEGGNEGLHRSFVLVLPRQPSILAFARPNGGECFLGPLVNGGAATVRSLFRVAISSALRVY